MVNEIIPYLEMCRREGQALQRGMNFELGESYSVLLMSRRPNAPYRDSVEEGGTVLIYEGHDSPRSEAAPDPKAVDQPEKTPAGAWTENSRFYQAAQSFKTGKDKPHPVRVYEKIKQGIWSYNGLFHLVDAWREHDGRRKVFKFKLVAVEEDRPGHAAFKWHRARRRVIPTAVKLEVWKRDRGRCVVCGAEDELHFDHVLPYSKGGSSITAENVQLLCARHNLSKGSKIL